MGKVIDITENEPHKVSEVVCLKCLKRWIAVRHIDTKLKDLECGWCKSKWFSGTGYVIETGEILNEK